VRPKANQAAGVVQKGLPGKKHKGLRRFSCRWGKRARKRTELLQGHPRDVGVLGEGD
jgi:hypothetical protein